MEKVELAGFIIIQKFDNLLKNEKIMKNLLKMILASILFVCSTSVFAEGVNIVTLTTTASGKTQDEAVTNALRGAIEQAFGAFISSKTDIVNDDLIKDEIASVSNGNVKKYEVLSTVSLPDGETAVTVKAEVSTTKLTAFCESKGIEVEFKGALFAANIKLQELYEQNEKKAIANLQEIIFKMAPSCFDYAIKVDDPVVSDLSGKYKIRQVITISANENIKNIFNLINQTLSGLSMSPEEVANYEKVGKGLYKGLYTVREDEFFTNFRSRRRYRDDDDDMFISKSDIYIQQGRNYELFVRKGESMSKSKILRESHLYKKDGKILSEWHLYKKDGKRYIQIKQIMDEFIPPVIYNLRCSRVDFSVATGLKYNYVVDNGLYQTYITCYDGEHGQFYCTKPEIGKLMTTHHSKIELKNDRFFTVSSSSLFSGFEKVKEVEIINYLDLSEIEKIQKYTVKRYNPPCKDYIECIDAGKYTDVDIMLYDHYNREMIGASDVLGVWAYCHYSTGNYNEVIYLLKERIRSEDTHVLDNYFPSYCLLLGLSYKNLGNREEAIKYLKIAIRDNKDPDDQYAKTAREALEELESGK